MAVKTQGSGRIFLYVRSYYGLFIAGFIAMVAVVVGQLTGPLIIGDIVGEAIEKRDVQRMLVDAFLYVGVVLAMGILTYFETTVIARLGLKVVTKIKSDIFAKLLKLPVAYFDKHPVGELMARVESDSEKVKELFSRTMISLLTQVLFFVGMLAVLATKDFAVTAWMALPVPFILALVFWFFDYLRKYYEKSRKSYASVCAVITEYIQGIEVLKAFNRTRTAERILDKHSVEKRDVDVKASILEYGSMSGLGFFLGPVFYILIIKLITPQIFIGLKEIAALIVFLEYGKRIFDPIMGIAENIRGIQQGRVALRRIFQILDETSEDEGNEGKTRPAFEKRIEFKDVSFAYNEGEFVLENASFTIDKGETVALVGPSGSGKTTTVSLLCRFYPATRGEILVDGKPLGDLELRAWRRKIGLVLQDIYLFPGDILENVRVYDDSVSEIKAMDALKTVHAEGLVAQVPGGIRGVIHERGSNISMGEKQLVSFARAVAFDPEIVVMDEATASIDVKTERLIQESMKELLKGRTAVIVAHRLTSVVNADKILFFKGGRIIAQGRHEELLANLPEYAELVRLQFMGAVEESGAGEASEAEEARS